jgi:hypothetical protein
MLNPELLEMLENLLKQKNIKKTTGFDVKQGYPNTEWLINTIYMLDPGNEIFKNPVENKIKQIPKRY